MIGVKENLRSLVKKINVLRNDTMIINRDMGESFCGYGEDACISLFKYNKELLSILLEKSGYDVNDGVVATLSLILEDIMRNNDGILFLDYDTSNYSHLSYKDKNSFYLSITSSKDFLSIDFNFGNSSKTNSINAYSDCIKGSLYDGNSIVLIDMKYDNNGLLKNYSYNYFNGNYFNYLCCPLEGYIEENRFLKDNSRKCIHYGGEDDCNFCVPLIPSLTKKDNGEFLFDTYNHEFACVFDNLYKLNSNCLKNRGKSMPFDSSSSSLSSATDWARKNTKNSLLEFNPSIKSLKNI